MIHPKDKDSQNPRLQCVCCGQWKRLHTKSPQPPHDLKQTFFGGCEYSDGSDHLAHKGNDYDVCELCCHIECKKLAGCDCQCPNPKSGAALISEGCPVHSPPFVVVSTVI